MDSSNFIISLLLLRWPQYIFPQFKIITSNCLKKIRVGEQTSLVRFVHNKTAMVVGTTFNLISATLVCWYLVMFWEERVKVPWPLSCREGLVHYFSFDYFQDGLVVVLINSVCIVNHRNHFHLSYNFVLTNAYSSLAIFDQCLNEMNLTILSLSDLWFEEHW